VQILPPHVPERGDLPGARGEQDPPGPRARLCAGVDGAGPRLPGARRDPDHRPRPVAPSRGVRGRTARIAEIGVVAGAYAVLTLLLAPASYGPLQLRFAELLKPLVIWEPHLTRGLRSSDRKSTRLNSSHVKISYAVFCLKKKKHKNT